jgi:hypothetical protein
MSPEPWRCSFRRMTGVEVRLAHEGDAETMAAIYVTARVRGWAHFFAERNLETVQPPVIASWRDRVHRPAPAGARRRQGREGGRLRCCPAVPRRGRRQGPSGRARRLLLRSTAMGGPRGVRSANGVGARDFRQSGYVEATLSTSTDNHRRRRIYEVAGWRREGQHTMKRLGTAWRDVRFRIKL